MSTSRLLCVSILTVLLLPGLARGSQWAAADSEYIVVSRLLAAVDAYVVDHHRFFEPLPEGMMCLPEDTIARLNALAEVPREARKAPREGEIFTPDVANLFRRLLTTRLFGDEYSDALAAEMEKRALIAPPVRVNKPLAWDIDNAVQLPVLRDLPLLPEELEYQLVGRDLVLVDVPSNLVVDVIRAALPTD
jgi:hypothetical protein